MGGLFEFRFEITITITITKKFYIYNDDSYYDCYPTLLSMKI